MTRYEYAKRDAPPARVPWHAGGLRRVRAGALALLLLLAGSLLAVQVGYAQDAVGARHPVVNINTADAATLAARLQGVGEARAKAIVRYRETYGPFSKVEELTEIKGIGQSTLELNRGRIALQ